MSDDQTGVRAGWVHVPHPEGRIRGYLALPPTGPTPAPVVLMAHENLGITPHRQKVTRELAEAGMACLTVDMYTRVGGMPPQDYRTAEERRSKAFLEARDEQVVPWLAAALDALGGIGNDVDTSQAGAVGFCLGGGSVMAWSAQGAPLRCVVSLYGIPVLPAEYSPTGSARSRIDLLDRLSAPIQFHFGTADTAIPTEQVDALEAALEKCPRGAELHRYEGAGHAYHDDTHPNYDSAAAALTWGRVLAFLRRYLQR